jgi:hypothetical protein
MAQSMTTQIHGRLRNARYLTHRRRHQLDNNEQVSGSQDGHAVDIVDCRDDPAVDFEPTLLPCPVDEPASPAEAAETLLSLEI